MSTQSVKTFQAIILGYIIRPPGETSWQQLGAVKKVFTTLSFSGLFTVLHLRRRRPELNSLNSREKV